jgi:phage tail sheath gpL-like
MVLFDLLPATTRSPLTYVEIAPSRSANALALKPYKVLLIGQKRSGAVAALTLTRVTSAAAARTQFGAGSHLSEMVATFLKNNKATECWALPTLDGVGATAEIRTLAFGGTVTAAGVLAYYFGGHRIAVAVANGEASNTTAANLAAAMALDPDLPFIFSVATNVVTITAKNAGACGSEISVRHSYGANEALPTGMTVVQTVTTPGAGTVNYATVGIVGIIAPNQYDVIVVDNNDATNLATITADLADRWGPVRQTEGVVISGFAGDLSAALAQGALLNSEFSSQTPAKNAPQPSWIWAAALGANVAYYGAQDPARGFNTIPLQGILPPASADRYTPQEKESLLHTGMATYQVSADGTVQMHRLISNYQFAPGGSADTTYLDLNTVLTLAFMRYDWRTTWQNRYPRHKLANDGTNFAPGQPIMTPERGRAEAATWGAKMEAAGYLEGLDQFKADLVVERNANDPTRLDFLLPVNLVNQLQVIAARLEFTV